MKTVVVDICQNWEYAGKGNKRAIGGDRGWVMVVVLLCPNFCGG